MPAEERGVRGAQWIALPCLVLFVFLHGKGRIDIAFAGDITQLRLAEHSDRPTYARARRQYRKQRSWRLVASGGADGARCLDPTQRLHAWPAMRPSARLLLPVAESLSSPVELVSCHREGKSSGRRSAERGRALCLRPA